VAILKINSKRALNRLDRIANNLNTIPWGKIGELAKKSVQTNFTAGGRPVKWRKRKDNKPHPILIKSGILKNSIYSETHKFGVTIGSRVPYQAVHEYGYQPRNIPARPYLMLQTSDKVMIKKMIKKHILRK